MGEKEPLRMNEMNINGEPHSRVRPIAYFANNLVAIFEHIPDLHWVVAARVIIIPTFT